MIAGGEAGWTLKTSEVFYSGGVSACNIPPFPTPIQLHASEATPNGIVICGGSPFPLSCFRLSSKNEWVSFPSLNSPRLRFNMFYMNEKLWAIGGVGIVLGSVGRTSVEYIDPTKESQWTEIRPQPIHWSASHSCTTELSSNRVIETGGKSPNVSSTINYKTHIPYCC